MNAVKSKTRLQIRETYIFKKSLKMDVRSILKQEDVTMILREAF